MATGTPTVPFFNYSHAFIHEEESLVSIFREVGRRGAFIMQKDLEEFETAVAAYAGVKYALGVGNATDGLVIACRAAGLHPGDEVILSSHTMMATAIGIHEAGATPVPVDCGEDHVIDPDAVERAMTAKTRAVLPTHLNGRVADMAALRELADRKGLLVLEDAAQALGARFSGQSAGSFGVAAAVSFYPAKTLGCLGDGGVVLTSDAGVYERLWALRDFGRNKTGQYVGWGLNTRLDNLQAAILNRRLKDYDDTIRRRRQLASLYHAALVDLPQLLLPPPPDEDGLHFDVYQNYEIEAERRDGLREHLSKHGVGTLIQWGGVAVHHCRDLGFRDPLPRTDARFARMLMLPLNLSLTDDDVHHVARSVRAFYES